VRKIRTEEGKKFPMPGPPAFKDGSKKEIKVRPVTNNGRTLAGFIICIAATNSIYQEGMNLHGVSFLSDSDDNLMVVFKLKI
jgi:hypothetical protein